MCMAAYFHRLTCTGRKKGKGKHPIKPRATLGSPPHRKQSSAATATGCSRPQQDVVAVAPVLVSVTVETGLQLESGATAKETKETAEATNAGARLTNVAGEASLSACTYLPIQHTSKLVHAAPGSQEAGQEAGQGAVGYTAASQGAIVAPAASHAAVAAPAAAVAKTSNRCHCVLNPLSAAPLTVGKNGVSDAGILAEMTAKSCNTYLQCQCRSPSRYYICCDLCPANWVDGKHAKMHNKWSQTMMANSKVDKTIAFHAHIKGKGHVFWSAVQGMHTVIQEAIEKKCSITTTHQWANAEWTHARWLEMEHLLESERQQFKSWGELYHLAIPGVLQKQGPGSVGQKFLKAQTVLDFIAEKRQQKTLLWQHPTHQNPGVPGQYTPLPGGGGGFAVPYSHGHG